MCALVLCMGWARPLLNFSGRAWVYTLWAWGEKIKLQSLAGPGVNGPGLNKKPG